MKKKHPIKSSPATQNPMQMRLRSRSLMDKLTRENVGSPFLSLSLQAKKSAATEKELKRAPHHKSKGTMTSQERRSYSAAIVDIMSASDQAMADTQDMVGAGTPPQTISDLPAFALLEIISFLYDDRDALRNIVYNVICKQRLEVAEIKKHIRASILERPERVLCRICIKTPCYPYKLVQCGHEVCGRCAWKHHRKACGCGAEILSRPEQVNPSLADRKAFWLLSKKENFRRIARNEKRVHKGTSGVFGKSGNSNGLEPFRGVGFLSDFDNISVLDLDLLTDSKKLPRGVLKKLWITLCPINRNYTAFSISKISTGDMKKNWSQFTDRFQHWLTTLNRHDVILLGEELTDDDIYPSNSTQRARFEVRLIGWEHLTQK
jgi:hypothetical protein